MGLVDKIKKSIELKHPSPNISSIEKTENKILKLTKESELNPNDSKILLELYTCYVETSNSEKKIECLEKLSSIFNLPDLDINEIISFSIKPGSIVLSTITKEFGIRISESCEPTIVNAE